MGSAEQNRGDNISGVARRLLRPTPFWLGCVFVVVCVIAYLFLNAERPDALRALDNQMISAMFRWRGVEAVSGEVVVVDIDEKSLARYGQWPWPRDMVAQLVAMIGAAKPKVLGLDIVFAEEDRSSPAHVVDYLRRRYPRQLQQLGELPGDINYDELLGEALASFHTVLGYSFLNDGVTAVGADPPWPGCTIRITPVGSDYRQLVLPRATGVLSNIPDISQGESEGFFNVFPDRSGTVRRVPLMMLYGDMPYPSLALEMVRIGLQEQVLTLRTAPLEDVAGRLGVVGVTVGEHFLPTDSRGQVSVNFRGPSKTFLYISAADVLAGKCVDQLRERYVLLGTSAAGLFDLRATPFSAVVPGVEVHATIIDNVLSDDLFRRDLYTESAATLLILLMGGLLLSACLSFAGPVAGGILGALILAAVVVGDYRLFFLRHVQIGIVYPLLCLVALFLLLTLYNYFYSAREKRFIREAFSQYVSPHIVAELVKNPQMLSLSGQQKELTVMFSDIRSFTSLSEQLDTHELGRFMNEYLSAMSDIVMDTWGMVDKYIGDAIMALWGAPLEDEQHASRAVACALRMIEALPRLNDGFTARGLLPVNIGIGINTGLMQVGNFGSEKRFDYTVLGDNVNLSSRLEGLNKNYGTNILISQFTYARVADTYRCRFIDRVKVQGKSNAVAIYEPLTSEQLASISEEQLQMYAEALDLYWQRDFSASLALFSSLEQRDDIQLYRLYRQRCEHYIAEAPPSDWDGAASWSK